MIDEDATKSELVRSILIHSSWDCARREIAVQLLPYHLYGMISDSFSFSSLRLENKGGAEYEMEFRMERKVGGMR